MASIYKQWKRKYGNFTKKQLAVMEMALEHYYYEICTEPSAMEILIELEVGKE